MSEAKRRPPGHLSPAAKRWYNALEAEYALETVHELLLGLAAESWDRAAACRKVLAREGLYFTDHRGLPRAHPAAAVLRDSILVFSRLIRQLGFEESGEADAGGYPVLVTRSGRKVYESNAARQAAYRERTGAP